MSLKFTIIENPLKKDPKAYYAKVQGVETIDLDTLIKHMTLPGALSATHTKAVLTEYHYQLVHLLRMGYAINDGLVRYRPSISGNFLSEEDRFDPERHKKIVRISATSFLNESISDMDITRIETILVESQIRSFYDLVDEVKNDTFKAENMAMIKGRQLLFDKTDEKQGIFLINKAGKAFRIQQYGIIHPSQVIFNIPSYITEGLYQLELHSCPDHLDNTLKTKFRKIIHCIPQ